MPKQTAIQQGEQAGLSYRLAPPRSALRGAAGFHAGSQKGVSLDFSDYREYHPGDDVRSLDWNVFARTDKLTLKLYHEEVSPHVDILLDSSESMALGTAKPDALHGLGALFATAASTGDCSWHAFTLGTNFQPLECGHDVPSRWQPIEFDAQANPAAQLMAGTTILKRQSIRLLVSDLLWDAEPLAALRRISEGASNIIVVQLLSHEDIQPPEHGKYLLEDAETGGTLELFIDSDTRKRYFQALENHSQLWAEACRQTGAVYCRLIAEEVLDGWRLDPLLRAGVLEYVGGAG